MKSHEKDQKDLKCAYCGNTNIVVECQKCNKILCSDHTIVSEITKHFYCPYDFPIIPKELTKLPLYILEK